MIGLQVGKLQVLTALRPLSSARYGWKMDKKSMWTSVIMKANNSWYNVPGMTMVAKPTRISFFATCDSIAQRR